MFTTCRNDGNCLRLDCKFKHTLQQKYNAKSFTIPCKYEEQFGSCTKTGKCTFKHNNPMSKCEEELRRDKDKLTPITSRPESKFPDFIRLVSNSSLKRERSNSPPRDSLQRKRERSNSPSRDYLPPKRGRYNSPPRDSLPSMGTLINKIITKYDDEKEMRKDLELKYKDLEKQNQEFQKKEGSYKHRIREYQDEALYKKHLIRDLQETVSINERNFGKYQDNDTNNKIHIACLEQQVKELTAENTKLKLKN
jgi:hypothetical protein